MFDETPMLRIRRKTAPPRTMTKIGEVTYQCFSPWSDSVSFLEEPIGISAEVGDGVDKLCIDQNHGSLEEYDTGGPLFLSSVTRPFGTAGGGTWISRPFALPPGAATHNGFDGSDWRAVYSGGFALPSDFVAAWADPAVKPIEPDEAGPDDINPDNVSTLGPRAYARLRPKVAVAGAFQAIAEAKDVPRTIQTTLKGAADVWKGICHQPDLMPRFQRARALRAVKRFPKKASQHYLNTVFGWAPLVKDVTDLCDLILFFPDHVAKQKRRNGRWRQVQFHEDVVEQEDVLYSTTGANTNFCSPSFGTDFVVPGSGSYELVRQLITRVWYNGSVRQYFPEFDDSLMSAHPDLQKAAQIVRLAGLEVNPVNIYKVIPWTWAVDWIANVGDNIQALQDLATDAVAFKYVYLMRHSTRRLVYRCKWTNYNGENTSLEWVANHTVKARWVGQSPFGFSLLAGGLSAKQLAVATALGLGGTKWGNGRVTI